MNSVQKVLVVTNSLLYMFMSIFEKEKKMQYGSHLYGKDLFFFRTY